MSTNIFAILIFLVALERLAELIISKRNVNWSKEQGGIEFGFGHYPFMVILHMGLLVGSLIEINATKPTSNPALMWSMLILTLASQALRWWCIITLGRRWNTRIVIVPNLPRISAGPYRYLKHPNYIAVVIEGFALPLVGQAWLTALIFTLLNIPLLYVRIRAEDKALDLLVGETT